MQIVPIQATPSQTVKAQLGGQNCQISIRSTLYGLFLDLAVDQAAVISGALCLDRNPLVRSAYLGFTGDLMFTDTSGTDDPTVEGLGTRFLLCYLDPDEVVL